MTEEEICTPDPHHAGMCMGVKGTALSWSSFASSPNAAATIMQESSKIFNHRFAATVYEQDRVYLKNGALKTPVWSARIMDAVGLAQAAHGFSYEPSATMVIRTRFDMMPVSYPLLSGEQRANPAKLFFYQGRPLVYAADVGDCQPDMHLYTSLDTFLSLRAPMWMGKTCTLSGEDHLPLWMDDWTLGQQHLQRTNLPKKATTPPLQPYPVGRNARLYCGCPQSLRSWNSNFSNVCRYWAQDHPFIRSTRPMYSCPVSPPEAPSFYEGGGCDQMLTPQEV